MVLPIMWRSFCSRRHAALQLFKPVQHYVDLRRRRLRLFDGLDHQESLPISRHVISSAHLTSLDRKILSLEECLGFSGRKCWLRRHFHSHHFAPAAKEQFSAIAVPSRIAAALGRDLPFPARAWIRLDVDF